MLSTNSSYPACHMPQVLPGPPRQVGTSWNAPRPAAASDVAAGFSTAQPLREIVPYVSRHTPKLHSRRMPSSPLQGLWQALAQAALRLELVVAAAVDKHRGAPVALSALAGVMVAMVSTLSRCRFFRAQQVFVCWTCLPQTWRDSASTSVEHPMVHIVCLGGSAQ